MLDEIYKATYIVSTGQQFLKQNQEKLNGFKQRRIKSFEAKKAETISSNAEGETKNKQQEKTGQESRHWTDSGWFKVFKTLLIIAILLKVIIYFIGEGTKLIVAAKKAEAAIMG